MASGLEGAKVTNLFFRDSHDPDFDRAVFERVPSEIALDELEELAYELKELSNTTEEQPLDQEMKEDSNNEREPK